MTIQTLSEFSVSDTTVRYLHDVDTGRVSLQLLPTVMLDRVVDRREPGSVHLDSLVHLKIVGDDYNWGFASGRTMRWAPSNDRFKFGHQNVVTEGDFTTIVTTLISEDGLTVEHRLSWYLGDEAMCISTTIINNSQERVTLEMLTSFSLGGISPFMEPGATDVLKVHRFRTGWSAEGLLETQSVEQLHLEPSWNRCAYFCERFGQVGSMPVRGWFPFVAVEDVSSKVVWGAQVAWAGSWQLEVFRRDDFIAISGGLADREFGQWTKTLARNEQFVTPLVTVAVAAGGLDDVCDRLTAVQHRAADLQPEAEHNLPIVFNEYCSTWGNPTHELLESIAARLSASKVRYLVIDAGWYKSGTDWGSTHGEWVPSPDLFPNGLKATADMIRSYGLTPGLWFEMENCGKGTPSYWMTDLLLKRDGIPLTVGERRFWDLNDYRAVKLLSERVIDLLESCGFGYLKVDYNENLGIGVDGSESLGEGLRRQIDGVYRFFDLIRQRLPNLVIENCASGGHRLEPSMLARTSMSSFSDAHETVEIPIIAANLQRLILPRQSQIWAVLRTTDSKRRLIYSLASTFLGRMCLSGDIDRLEDEQWEIVSAAQALYEKSAPVIKHGMSRRSGSLGLSWRKPLGWQAVTRTASDGRSALVVLHAFVDAPVSVTVDLPPGEWSIRGSLSSADYAVVDQAKLTARLDGEYSGQVILLER